MLVHNAVEANKIDEVERLIQNKHNVMCPHSEYGDTPLHLAAYHGFTDIARLLLSSRASISIRNNSGSTPLDYAVDRGCQETIKLLKEHGAK